MAVQVERSRGGLHRAMVEVGLECLEQLLPAPGLGIEKRPEAVGDEALGQARVLSEDEVGDDLVVAVRDHVRAQLAPRLDGLLSLQVRPRDSSETGMVAADAGANPGASWPGPPDRFLVQLRHELAGAPPCLPRAPRPR